MDDFGRALVVFAAAINPAAAVLAFGAAAPAAAVRRRVTVTASLALIAMVLLALAAALRDPLLDLLDVSGESFDVAAGFIMVAGAARPLLQGQTLPALPSDDGKPGGVAALAPLVVPVLAGPAALAAAVAYVERYDAAPALAAAAVVLAATAAASAVAPRLTRSRRSLVLAAVVRVTAVLLVFIAVGLTVDAIQSV